MSEELVGFGEGVEGFLHGFGNEGDLVRPNRRDEALFSVSGISGERGSKRLTPLSTTASEPTSTMSTRSMTYATAESRTTVHGIPAAVRI